MKMTGQVRAVPGVALGWDLGAAMALAGALGFSPIACAELLPEIEAVAVAKLNERMEQSHG